MDIETYRKIILENFKGHWLLNDEAHREEHFIAVEQCAHEICKRLNLEVRPLEILYTAYFHDLFAWSRSNHHMLSAVWINTTDSQVIKVLDPNAIRWVSSACLEHRASGEMPFTRWFSELMCSADREYPSGVDKLMDRSIKFSLAKGFGQKEAVDNAILHVKEKFSRTGYARYPKMYQDAFRDELEAQWNDIDNL